ncbi:MAG: DUF805 domain-containing protein [Alphaproteobacteria bacterium]|nr:DUF805 domain-containing protein [Alphaproteobacteria bacterium]MDE2631076.1 DUF805 domain-containing protein [Alphaproteobacteria bacterium]
MGFTTAVATGFQKYVTFTGRARRSEFWFFTLYAFLAAVAAMVVDRFVDPPAAGVPYAVGIVYIVVVLVNFLPGLAVTVRRLHDTNRSGWWVFIALVPFLGAILLIVWYCTKGTQGDNRFGPDPRATA